MCVSAVHLHFDFGNYYHACVSCITTVGLVEGGEHPVLLTNGCLVCFQVLQGYFKIKQKITSHTMFDHLICYQQCYSCKKKASKIHIYNAANARYTTITLPQLMLAGLIPQNNKQVFNSHST